MVHDPTTPYTAERLGLHEKTFTRKKPETPPTLTVQEAEEPSDSEASITSAQQLEASRQAMDHNQKYFDRYMNMLLQGELPATIRMIEGMEGVELPEFPHFYTASETGTVQHESASQSSQNVTHDGTVKQDSNSTSPGSPGWCQINIEDADVSR